MKSLRVLGILLALSLAGCAYNHYNQDFFARCRAQVPAVRAYAIAHMVDLSDADKKIINTTEPHLAQANWVSVDFTWPGICRVNSGAPPDCQPFTTTDLRRIHGGGKGAPPEPTPPTSAQIKSLGIPCGTYAPARVIIDRYGRSYTNTMPPAFTLCLETNGTYVAESIFPEDELHDDRLSLDRNFEQSGWHWQAPTRSVANPLHVTHNIHHGHWHWEPMTRTFVLDPGAFMFYIARLPVDPTNPNRLLWGSSNVSGGQDYLERVENSSTNR